MIIVNDSIQSNSPKSLDNKYLNLGIVPYVDKAEVNGTILGVYRSRGLTVNIAGAEYWYRDGLGDVNLVAKGITSAISPITIDGTTGVISMTPASNSVPGYLTSGDWTAFNNKLGSVSTAMSVTNTGVSGNPITLVNDQSTPGSTRYYGTNGSGVKGYYSIPISSGGGSIAWGAITGVLSDQTDLGFALAAKEPTIAAGTTAQYWRGDKSWQTLNTTAVPEGSNPYFTTARARASVSAGTGISYNSTTGVIASVITQADGSETKLTAGSNITITGTGTISTPYVVSTTGGGTVTSVGLTSTDFSVSGSPITLSGSITANLATTGVTAGSYTFPSITVDSKGRLTAASNGTLPIATSSVFGVVKIGANINVASGVISVTFPTEPIASSTILGGVKIGSGVTVAGDGTISVAGYTLPIASGTILGGVKVGSGLAIDGTGILSSTAGGGSVTSVGLSSTDLAVSGSPITGAGTITANLTATGVSAGTYNTLTVDVKGRVTAATNTSYLTANQTITLSGDTTGSGTTSIVTTLANSGVTAGSYTRATITVDAKGRITAASSNTAVTSVSFTSSDLVITGSPITSTGTFTATLGTVNANVGTFNNVTVNAKGLVTAASNASYISANQTITLSGDVGGSGTTAISATIQPAAVTYTKIQNVTAARLLGRYTASSGSTQEITVGSGLNLDSSTGILTSSGGTVTASNGLGATSNNVTLGGALTTNTSITGGGGSFNLSLGTSGDRLVNAFIYTLQGLQASATLYNSIGGTILSTLAGTINNASTAINGTVTNFSSVAFFAPTITSTNTGVKYNRAATVYIDGPPTFSTNSSSVTNAQVALDIASGTAHFGGTGVSIAADGSIVAGTTPSSYGWLGLGANTTGKPSIYLVASAGVDLSSPTGGEVWYNGTNLYFGSPSAVQIDLLESILVTAATSLTLSSNATKISFTGSSAASWTLPTPGTGNGGQGTLFRIKNRGSATITLNSFTGSQIYTTSAQASVTITAGNSITLWADGVFWLVQS